MQGTLDYAKLVDAVLETGSAIIECEDAKMAKRLQLRFYTWRHRKVPKVVTERTERIKRISAILDGPKVTFSFDTYTPTGFSLDKVKSITYGTGPESAPDYPRSQQLVCGPWEPPANEQQPAPAGSAPAEEPVAENEPSLRDVLKDIGLLP